MIKNLEESGYSFNCDQNDSYRYNLKAVKKAKHPIYIILKFQKKLNKVS